MSPDTYEALEGVLYTLLGLIVWTLVILGLVPWVARAWEFLSSWGSRSEHQEKT